MVHYPSRAASTDAGRAPQSLQAFLARGEEGVHAIHAWHFDGPVARLGYCGGVVVCAVAQECVEVV